MRTPNAESSSATTVSGELQERHGRDNGGSGTHLAGASQAQTAIAARPSNATKEQLKLIDQLLRPYREVSPSSYS